MAATPNAVIRDPSRRCRFMGRRPAAQSGPDTSSAGAARVTAMALEAAASPLAGKMMWRLFSGCTDVVGAGGSRGES